MDTDYTHRRTKKKLKKVRERRKPTVLLKRGRCRSGYPPAEGRVEHSQRNSSQENYIVFSLERQKRATEEGQRVRESSDSRAWKDRW